jgi:hypothetical protein
MFSDICRNILGTNVHIRSFCIALLAPIFTAYHSSCVDLAWANVIDVTFCAISYGPPWFFPIIIRIIN